jgi:hypothetical protein
MFAAMILAVLSLLPAVLAAAEPTTASAPASAPANRPQRAYKGDPNGPEVLFLGPIEPVDTALVYDLLYSYLVESGVYVDVGTDGILPEQMPWDLSQYKVVVIDKALPLYGWAGTKEHLARFEKAGGVVIYHQRPEKANWNANVPDLYAMYDQVIAAGVKKQNPAFLARNAAVPDKQVILNCATWMTKVPNLTNWFLMGNDVAYMNFEGILKTAELYDWPDLRGFVLWMTARIAAEHGDKEVGIYAGHLIAEFRGPGFEPYLARTLKQMTSAADMKTRVAQQAQVGRFWSGEALEPMFGYTTRAKLFNEPDYFQPAVDTMKLAHQALYDPNTHLWAHGGRDANSRTPCWSRGYGWMLLGLCGIIENLPKDHPDYPLMVQYLEQTTEGLIATQDKETGLWHCIVDDPSTRLEASGTGMIVRSYCRAWRAGAGQSPQVKEMLTRAWCGIKAHTLGYRTFSFLWGKGPSNDKASYAVTPSSGIPYVCPLAGPEYVKTFGPLVP